MSHGRLVIVDRKISEGEPIRAVSYLEPEADWDSGFALFAAGPEQECDTELACLDCLLDEHPGIGAALDIARETGEWTSEADGQGLSQSSGRS